MANKHKCRIKGCQEPVEVGGDLCWGHRLQWNESAQEIMQQRLEELEQDFRETFGSAAGERVLAYLGSAFYLNETTITVCEGRIDPYQMAIKEGGRMVVLRIKTLAGRLK